MSDKDKQKNQIASPCISLCTLNGEGICSGCYRHIDEITGWHSATKERRLQILENCKQRKTNN